MKQQGIIKMQTFVEFVRYATMAPSGHNTQPWKFSVGEDCIRIFPDFTRALPVVDPTNRELYISLGCALENLVIAAKHAGYDPEVKYFQSSEPDECLLVTLKYSNVTGDNNLFQAISGRHTNRREYNKQPIPASDLKKIESVPMEEGVTALMITDPIAIDQIIRLVMEGNRIQMNDGAFMDEITFWIRFSDSEEALHLDGLTSRAMGRSPAPGWLGRLFMRIFVGAQNQSKTDEMNIRSSSALMLVISVKNLTFRTCFCKKIYILQMVDSGY